LAKGDIARLISYANEILSISSIIFARYASTRRKVGWYIWDWDLPFCGNGRLWGHSMIQRWCHSKERFWFPISSSVHCDDCAISIRSQFAVECLGSSNPQGWVTLGQNLERNGQINVSQILTRTVRDSCRTQKKSFVDISSAAV